MEKITIEEYDIFFNEYKIKGESDINDVEKLLNNFQNYLDLILKDNKWFRNIDKLSKDISTKEVLENTINNLTKYMNIIHNYYAKIDHDTIKKNIDINFHFVDIMTTAIIILYSYVYHNNIFELKSHHMDTFKNYYQSIFLFFMKKIINHCYSINININDEELLFKFKDIIYNKEPKCFRFVKTQMKLIIDFINKISIFHKIAPLNTRYVTIPKYTGICWFVSFIVGITYSDKNKELLLKKSTMNNVNCKKNTDISQLSANEIFTTLIYRIIREITKDTKTYDMIEEAEMNELNIYLKETPIQCLIKLINEYLDTKDKTTLPREYSFIKEHIEKHENFKRYELNEYEQLGDVGIGGSNYFFLNLLYRFLNINSLYLIQAAEKTFTYDESNNDPDVILINTKTNLFNGESLMIEHQTNSKKIVYEDITSNIIYDKPNNCIKYNNNTYKLDYILYNSDIYNSWNNTGHAIVALTYDNNEYFYDSRYYIREYTYNGKTLRYSCPLLRKNWKDDYYTQNGNFCVKKCYHTEIKPLSSLYLKTKNLSEENICYKSNTDIICCYVKVSETSEVTETSGGNINYKITNNKIEFQYKNKKYIRNIYINSKKKYVKFNNEYILLSKIKSTKSQTLEQLKEQCKSLGIKGYSKKKKDELIELIKNHK
jgi:hypothetical protein